jgi:hypothetical protein
MTAREAPQHVSAQPVPAAPERRSRWRAPAPLALLGIAGTLITALTAVVGGWFTPIVVGIATGAATRRRPAGRGLAVACAAGVGGWGLPLLWAALHGAPIVATARVVAALAGLPAASCIPLLAGALTALLQAVSGYLLGRVLAGLLRSREN